ncbi:MAG: hypothetical protein H7Z42_14010 [Roseiflexaceae bacterium]|nr:hypothetical protein [Roseiflexaceae bacterium]
MVISYEDKIIGLYGKGMSARDIQDTLHEAYGVEVSPQITGLLSLI